jgi:dihydropteroate synthase
MVNDISGLRRDPALASVCAELDAAIILGHCRGTPATMQQLAEYTDVVAEVMEELAESVERALRAGIPRNNILIDPGLGFSKLASHNWEILRRLGEFRSLGFPIVAGASRKSFLGDALAGRPPREREAASLAAATLAAESGARLIRVHEVAPCADALRVVNAMRNRHDSNAVAKQQKAATQLS